MARNKPKKEKIPWQDRKLVKWTKEHAPDLLGGVLTVGGTIFQMDGLKDLGNKIMGKEELTPEQKEEAMEILKLDIEALKSEDANITERWVNDNQSDSWMSKNARPFTLFFLLLFTGVIIVLDSIGWFRADGITPMFDVKPAYITLLQSLLITVIVAYFGSRGLKHLDERRLKNGKDPLNFNPFKK